jgi:hypothetical protein
MIRATSLVLLAATLALAQDFSFRQDCTLTLHACDMARETGQGECPYDLSLTAQFHAEGDAFYLAADGLGDDPLDGSPQLLSLGQGYFTDAIRIYYVKDDPVIDGMFWIAADGNSGAQLYHDGFENYFTAVCVPLPD